MGRFILVVGFLFFLFFGLYGQTRTFYEHGYEITHFEDKAFDGPFSSLIWKDKDGRLYMDPKKMGFVSQI